LQPLLQQSLGDERERDGLELPAGTIAPSSVTVTLAPPTGAVVTTPATSVVLVSGTVRRVYFVVPASVVVATPTAYKVSISGTSAGALPFPAATPLR